MGGTLQTKKRKAEFAMKKICEGERDECFDMR